MQAAAPQRESLIKLTQALQETEPVLLFMATVYTTLPDTNLFKNNIFTPDRTQHHPSLVISQDVVTLKGDRFTWMFDQSDSPITSTESIFAWALLKHREGLNPTIAEFFMTYPHINSIRRLSVSSNQNMEDTTVIVGIDACRILKNLCRTVKLKDLMTPQITQEIQRELKESGL